MTLTPPRFSKENMHEIGDKVTPAMDEIHFQVIKQEYQKRGEDFTNIFAAILSVANEVGLDEALKYLEQCVIQKRLSWLDEQLGTLEKTGDPLLDAYTSFYEIYLGISMPKDGEIVQRSEGRLITRWWNPCPVLDACIKLGLDTREICRKAYHRPVQIFLSRIDPKLRFDRNYDCVRPYTPYCEEIITWEE